MSFRKKKQEERYDYYTINSKTDLPFQPTPKPVIQSIFDTLERDYGLIRGSPQRFIDIGAGDGRVIAWCARECDLKADGIEIDPALAKQAKKTIRKELGRLKSRRASISTGDLFTANLESYDYVFVFAQPHVHEYMKHVFKTAGYGTIVISYQYPLKELEGGLLEPLGSITVSINGKDQGHDVFFYKRT